MTTAISTEESRRLWRQRREERREKQRQQNVVRAQKMRAARLKWEKESSATKPRSQAKSKRTIHVGCSGWYYWHWRGQFYPQDSPTASWFAHYAEHFDTVELNAPFYSWPTCATVSTWKRQAAAAGPGFVYAIKVNELITHRKRFVGTKTLVRDFSYIADCLGDAFGCFLFQLPPSFHYSKGSLKRIVHQLDPSRRNVVEFRHRSWWNQTVYDAFRDAGIIFCSCSGPRLPDDLVKTTPDIYIRFHGTTRWYRHNYSTEELTAWASKIKRSRARRIWCYFNNDREANAIRNASELIPMLAVRRNT